MKKRMIAMLVLVMLFLGAFPVMAMEEAEGVSVYVTMSVEGTIAESKSGEAMACVPVLLQGKEEYTLDDVFTALHAEYYTDGTEGYASSVGKWGLSIDKLWGDTSKKYGYQVNGGVETVSGLGFMVEDGDYIDACIYENFYPNTEGYAAFDKMTTKVETGEALDITLTYVSGYDENRNTVISPCEGAIITVDGIETDVVTDENGQATITLEQTGDFIISAKKSKTLENGTVVAAITAPVCVATVTLPPEIEIIHNIAANFADCNFAEAGGNLPWIVADMVAYESVFPDSEFCLNETKKEEALKALVNFAKTAETPGDLSKGILALRSLGYDARNIYTEQYEHIDLVSKLTALVDSDDGAVTNIYTLPYVILALSQAEEYATAEQMEKLVCAAVTSAADWQVVEYGTDAMTPMILALSPYYETDSVKAVVDEATEIVKAEQRSDGLIDGFEGYESASTGLAICAFSAMKMDASTIANGGKSLIDGLLSTANGDLTGFPNAFATEQGFRGLLAWRLLSDDGERMYDFSDFSMEEANASDVAHCPVIFDVIPGSGAVTVQGAEAVSKNCYDLAEGVYSYSVAAVGYINQTGLLSISAEDAEKHMVKRINISLTRPYVSGGGGTTSGSVTLITPEKIDVDNQDTKQEAERTTFTDKTFSDVRSGEWYYDAVQYVYEKNLLQGTGKGFEPNATMTRGMLVTVLYRLASPEEEHQRGNFTDVPSGSWFSDSVAWAAGNKLVSGVSETSFAPDASITREQLAVILYRYAAFCGCDVKTVKGSFDFQDADNISEYAREAMKYAVDAGIINGTDENLLAPKKTATRAEVSTMIMRFAEVIEK
ncbi:MAG: S-layer homology domain-containing protein [Clostridia bacterium]|nr:S-layer homology domain-containing protein [Clostridia bacterium]